MAHSPEVRAAVRAAYIFDKLTLEGAAEKHKVPVSTARKWKTQDGGQGDDWDKARAAFSLSKSGGAAVAQIVLSDFLSLHQATTEDLLNDKDIKPATKAEMLSRLADAFSKTMAAVAKAAPELGHYAVATELLQELAHFVRENYPQHVEGFAEILQPFAAHISSKYE